jgi:hypothetical protein
MMVNVSSAYDHIDDPSDPAWIGHFELDATPWWRRRLVLGTAAAFLVAVVATLLIGRDDEPARASTRAAPAVGAAGSIEHSPVRAPSDAEVVSIPSSEQVAIPDAPKPEPAVGSGSGWAPAAATMDGSESGRLTGDLAGVSPGLRERLDRLAARLDVQIELVSGWRTHREQEVLYDKFLAGVGNLAAPPGLSRHESGMAADAYVKGTALANYPGAVKQARALGLYFPVNGEAWHVEPIETASM